MANRHHTTLALILGLCPGLSLGCYSGLDHAPEGGGDGQADGADDGGQADEDGGTPQDPAPEGPEAPFRVPADEARLLPFPVRMQNLAHVTGQSLDHPMFLALYDLRYQLGDHDFASGVAPDLRWSSEKMQNWVRGLKPVCQSAEMQQAYPDLLTDPRPLMRQAWGHEPTVEEVEALADLQGVTPEEQYTVTCIAVLTALDFVSI
ncbi:hypothetical protein [Paraliomyxa miuraensis]|uniref:hypothetical protein n=1 Tax=Paraliomyxa miuraensis TaxID=376150 RepID=UPI002258148C|nr:hypothetical protein [Paraliomyxa miuraensis]MCX4247403.1 hypothetical protein [Paraliomyxa miuraensis]